MAGPAASDDTPVTAAQVIGAFAFRAAGLVATGKLRTDEFDYLDDCDDEED
jgi:hypothetical protein